MAIMINLRALKGASVAASKDEYREYLRSVAVFAYNKENVPEALYNASRDGQALLISTDGHRLVYGLGEFLGDLITPEGSEPHDATNWTETIVPIDMVKAILRVKVAKEYQKLASAEYILLNRDGLNLRAVFADGQVVTGKAYDADYPDWRRVLKPALAYAETDQMANCIGFNACYLADLATFAAAFSFARSPTVKMMGDTKSTASPVLFESRTPAGSHGMYLLMPVRL